MILALVDQVKNINIVMAKHNNIAVVVGIIRDDNGKMFVAQRPPQVHCPGLWEFPGGKIEAGETPLQALIREYEEEVGINVISAHRLIQFPYEYPEQCLLLDFWIIDAYDGEPIGKLGQALRWVTLTELQQLPIPDATHVALQALQKL